MRTRLLLAIALVACAAPQPRPPRGEQVLAVEGKVENGPFRFGRDDLPDLPRRSFEALAPLEGSTAPVRFEGIALARLFTDEMEVQREADTAVFHGDDGVAAPVPLPLVRQLKPVLADHVNGGAVGAWRTRAAPLQLAWPNVGAPGIDTDPRMRWWWVGGIRKVVLQSWSKTYGKALRVPTGARDDARLGADALASECIGCHRVRGQGGTRGPELNGAVVRTREAFARAMRQHLRKVSGITGAPDVTPATANAIAAFLSAIQVAGRGEEEIEPPPEPETPELPPRGGFDR